MTEEALRRVRVAGSSMLARRVRRDLETAPPSSRDVPDTLVLVSALDAVIDGCHWLEPASPDPVLAGTAVLFVGVWGRWVYVGPLWRPGSPGCPRCVAIRTANSPFGPDLPVHNGVGSLDPTVEFGPGMLHVITMLVRTHLQGATTWGAAPSDHGGCQVTMVDTVTGTLTPRALVPDSTCTVCGATMAPVDAAAPLDDSGTTKITPSILRVRPVDLLALRADYLHPGPGLFKELRQDLQSPFGACSVELPQHFGRREPAIGRGSSYADSEAVAILEGLERYVGLHRGGAPSAVRAAYSEIKEHALDPRTLGVHPKECYDRVDFRYHPFEEDVVVDWVWARSLTENRPILVPERAAYWGPRDDGETPFFFDTSNGCALGGTFSEAVIHGLCEVVERDSFLMAWYRRLQLPEVSLGGIAPDLSALLRKGELFTGHRFRCFLSTMEYGVPSLLLLAEPDSRNSVTSGPVVVAGAAAHPDPHQALRGGLQELIGTVLALIPTFHQRRNEALAMLDRPELVSRMSDHCLVNSLPQARERFAHLLDGPGPTLDLNEVGTKVRLDSFDIREDLGTVLAGMCDAGLNVLVVDQTMPELERHGMVCVRVLVPGAVPMTFGHLNRRTDYLPRLVADGTFLPYPSRLPEAEPVGLLPHPFP